MVYIATQNISKEYKEGDEVPDSLALTWIKMFKNPPVKQSSGVSSSKAAVVDMKSEVEETVVEEKFDQEDYKADLLSIKGIGKKTVSDILEVYPDRESLKEAIDSGIELPFRDDVVDLLVDNKEKFDE